MKVGEDRHGDDCELIDVREPNIADETGLLSTKLVADQVVAENSLHGSGKPSRV